ncbi:MAG TPA: ABC transporter substrate-binding protein [Spirochaetota bacterium]|nr:ABC transporter substrate-binding protein [Spirochaetota bacterium]HPQ53664.1 ABC transporter substrate-binding protein [Spirochaetota bacterium]
MKETKRALFHKALAFLFCAVPLCCSYCAPPENPRYFQTYMQSDPGKLDPFYSTDVISGRVLTKICSGLFTIDSDGVLVPDLLRGYTFDGRVLRGTLRRGVCFHDGSELTADDVVFSFARIWKSVNPTSPRKWVFSNVREIKKHGRYRFSILLEKPHAAFLSMLTMPCCFIISRSAFTRDGSVIGSGPFALQEWRQDEKIVLRRNERYYGTVAALEGMVFRIIPEDLTARFEFLNGTLDYFDIPYLANAGFDTIRRRVVEVPELSVHYVALNTGRYPFSDESFRRALNMAVDKKAVMRCLFKGRFREAEGVVPPGAGGYRGVVRKYGYNPVEAEKIIARMGLRGKTVRVLIKSDNQVSLIMQLIQYYLSKAGLRVEIVPLEWSALKSRTFRGDFDMAYFTWIADYPEPENFFYPLFYSRNAGAGGNRSFYRSADVDRLIETARRATNRQKRFDIYRRIEGIILNEAPWIFLWYADKRIALGSRVKDYTPYPIFSGFKGNHITLREERK